MWCATVGGALEGHDHMLKSQVSRSFDSQSGCRDAHHSTPCLRRDLVSRPSTRPTAPSPNPRACDHDPPVWQCRKTGRRRHATPSLLAGSPLLSLISSPTRTKLRCPSTETNPLHFSVFITHSRWAVATPHPSAGAVASCILKHRLDARASHGHAGNVRWWLT